VVERGANVGREVLYLNEGRKFKVVLDVGKRYYFCSGEANTWGGREEFNISGKKNSKLCEIEFRGECARRTRKPKHLNSYNQF